MDRVRIGQFDRNGRFAPLLDVNDGTNYTFLRDTLAFRGGEASQVVVDQQRRWGGGRVVGETHANGQMEASWYVRGSTKNDSEVKADALTALLTRATPGLYIEDRPEGVGYSVYYEVRGPGKAEFVRSWIRFQQTSALELNGVIPTAPLPVGDYMDTFDDFSTDTVAAPDYTFISGSGTISVSAGALVPSDASTIKRLYHSAKGYAMRDTQVTYKVTTGTDQTNLQLGVLLRVVDSLNYMYAIVGTATSNSFQFHKVVNGVDTDLTGGTGTNAGGFANATTYWIRGRIDDGGWVLETFTAPPTPLSTPAGVGGPFFMPPEFIGVGGAAGIWVRPGNGFSGFAIDDLTIEPYTYRSRVLPERIVLPNVPGSAPAEVDLELTEAPAAAQPWAAFGWAAGERVRNFVWNGDFETDVVGWSTAALAWIHGAAATSITRLAGTAKYGAASAQVVLPATSDSGAHFTLYGPFKAGRTYTASMWMRSAAQTTSMHAVFGDASANSAGSTATALSPTWTLHQFTWTPSADVAVAYVGIASNAATATTLQIDGVQVYEGTVAPTLNSQVEGRGAFSPIGVIEAENSISSDTSGFALTADAGRGSGQVMQWTTSGAGTAQLAWFLDPGLIDPDDFTMGDLRIEAWAWVKLASSLVTPTLTLSARTDVTGGPERFTQEFPSGRVLTKPSSGTLWRLTRLGTLALRSDARYPARWKLVLGAGVATASSGVLSVDQLILIPAQRRLSSLTSRANDGSYPKFLPTTAETTRVVSANGTAQIRKPGGPSYPALHLSGPLPYMGPGNVTLVVATSNTVPDDPTVAAHEAAYGPLGTIHVAVRPRYFNGRGA